MSEVVGYGIDYGTTNSAISVAYEDRVEVLAVGPSSPSPVMPSITYLHRDGQRAAGVEAAQQFLVTGSSQTACSRCDRVIRDIDGVRFSECKQFTRGGGCVDSRLISGVKSELSEIGLERTHSWAHDFSMSELVSVVLSDLKRAADRHTGSVVSYGVIGHPVAFVGASGPQFSERQAHAEGQLLKGAESAGFNRAELYPEPAAAMLDEEFEDGFALSVDFGGGTFDLAVIHIEHGVGDIKSLDGAAVGGELFDALLFDHYVAPQFGLGARLSRDRPIPTWFVRELRSLSGVKRLLSNSLVPEILTDMRSSGLGEETERINAMLYGGHAYGFYRAIEDAKIGLTDGTSASIEFHRPGISVSIPIERATFDRLIADQLDVLMSQVERTLAKAGCSSRDVQAVIRTGGSSRIPAFVDRLDAMFEPGTVRARPALTSVAYGLGLVAMEEAHV